MATYGFDGEKYYNRFESATCILEFLRDNESYLSKKQIKTLVKMVNEALKEPKQKKKRKTK